MHLSHYVFPGCMSNEDFEDNDTKQVIAKVREQLDELGICSDYLREFLWQEYDRRGVGNRPDVYIFLDAILNQSVKSLDLHPNHFYRQPNTLRRQQFSCDVTKLVDIINKQCPSIQNLSLVQPKMSNRHGQAICFHPFLSLSKLTKLEVAWPTNTECRSFFTEIGNACPGLEHLKMGSFKFGYQFHSLVNVELEDLVALALGQNAKLLTPTFLEKIKGSTSDLHSLQFDEKLLTPICKSRKHLTINSSVMQNAVQNITSTAAAFLLRHIPQIEKLAIRFVVCWRRNNNMGKPRPPNTSLAIQLLYEQLLQPQKIISVSEGHLNWTINAPPPSIY